MISSRKLTALERTLLDDIDAMCRRLRRYALEDLDIDDDFLEMLSWLRYNADGLDERADPDSVLNESPGEDGIRACIKELAETNLDALVKVVMVMRRRLMVEEKTRDEVAERLGLTSDQREQLRRVLAEHAVETDPNYWHRPKGN